MAHFFNSKLTNKVHKIRFMKMQTEKFKMLKKH